MSPSTAKSQRVLLAMLPLYTLHLLPTTIFSLTSTIYASRPAHLLCAMHSQHNPSVYPFCTYIIHRQPYFYHIPCSAPQLYCPTTSTFVSFPFLQLLRHSSDPTNHPYTIHVRTHSSVPPSLCFSWPTSTSKCAPWPTSSPTYTRECFGLN